jgi:hypothetical protein
MAIFHRSWSPTGTAHRAAPAGHRQARPGQDLGEHRDGQREATRTMMWGLEAGGWTAREAGNLVGLLHGLRPARSGWSEREIEHLRFLRSLVDSGRLDH